MNSFLVLLSVLTALYTIYRQWLVIKEHFLRALTGRCEIERICYDRKGEFVDRVIALEKCLHNSNAPMVRSFASFSGENVKQIAKHITGTHKIPIDMHEEFSDRFCALFSRISSYNRLLDSVIGLTSQKFDSTNVLHINLLSTLWTEFNVGAFDEFALVSNKWQDLGFQSSNPATDFRGMGLLGLKQLVYFVQKHKNDAINTFFASLHIQNGYSFAIVGINVSSWLFQFLIAGELKRQFYLLPLTDSWLDYYNDLYCVLFMEFKKFWFEENAFIMEFEEKAGIFCSMVSAHLASGKVLEKGCF